MKNLLQLQRYRFFSKRLFYLCTLYITKLINAVIVMFLFSTNHKQYRPFSRKSVITDFYIITWILALIDFN